MRLIVRVVFAVALVSVVPLFLMGCDGVGLNVAKTTTSGDSAPSQDGGSSGGTTPTPGTTDTRFTGTWVASYGDDFITTHTTRDAFEYATLLRLVHSDTSITGSGYMYRFSRQGPQAWQKLNLNVTGTASGTDATLVLRPSLSAAFDAQPVWYIRLAGSRIVGMFQESTSTGELIRGGHAVWLKATTGDIDGAWAAAASDDYAVAGTDRLERTANMSLSQDTDSTVTGNGSFDVQRNSGSAPADFNVTRGIIDAPDMDFSFGELDLGANTLNWLGFFTGNAVVSAYGEFDGGEALLRLGHTTWYREPDPTTSAVTHDWVVSFNDSVTSGNVPSSDYLALMSLQAQDGGGVTGSGTVRVEADNTSLENFTVGNGTLVGSLLHLEMRNVTRTLVWDLRLAGSVMVGSYRELNGSGDFVSRGTGEWRTDSAPSVKGTWTTAYFDTYGAATPENTQFALVTISRQETNGALAGTGGLRFAGDTRRRLFNVDGNAASDEIIWIWRSQDLFGITTWHLRQAGNFLYGTYTNEDSSGALEYRGNALWIRTNQTDVVTQ